MTRQKKKKKKGARDAGPSKAEQLRLALSECERLRERLSAVEAQAETYLKLGGQALQELEARILKLGGRDVRLVPAEVSDDHGPFWDLLSEQGFSFKRLMLEAERSVLLIGMPPGQEDTEAATAARMQALSGMVAKYFEASKLPVPMVLCFPRDEPGSAAGLYRVENAEATLTDDALESFTIPNDATPEQLRTYAERMRLLAIETVRHRLGVEADMAQLVEKLATPGPTPESGVALKNIDPIGVGKLLKEAADEAGEPVDLDDEPPPPVFETVDPPDLGEEPPPPVFETDDRPTLEDIPPVGDGAPEAAAEKEKPGRALTEPVDSPT